MTSMQEGHRPDQQAVLASDPARGLRDRDGRTALHHAVRLRNYEMLTRCLEAKVLLGITDDTGRTPLFTAVIKGWLPGADRLLAAQQAEEGGVHILFHREDVHGGNLMHCAAISGSVEAVDWAWEIDPDPLDTFEHTDRHGCSAVRLAAESDKPGAAKVVSRLLQRASDLDETGSIIPAALERPDNTDGDTALLAAAEAGNAEVCTVLANWGAEVNVTNHAGESALCAAVRSGDEQTVQVLLDNGARLHLPSTQIANSPMTVARFALRNAEQQGDEPAAKSAQEIVAMLTEALSKPRNAASTVASADEAPGVA